MLNCVVRSASRSLAVSCFAVSDALRHAGHLHSAEPLAHDFPVEDVARPRLVGDERNRLFAAGIARDDQTHRLGDSTGGDWRDFAGRLLLSHLVVSHTARDRPADHRGERRPSGSQPGDHGGPRCDSAGAKVGPTCRRNRDFLLKHRRPYPSSSSSAMAGISTALPMMFSQPSAPPAPS